MWKQFFVKNKRAFLFLPAIALLLEVTIFQSSFWLGLWQNAPIQTISTQQLTHNCKKATDNSIIAQSNCVISIHDINIPITSVKLLTSGQNNTYSYYFGISDEAYQYNYRTTESFLSNTSLDFSQVARIHSNGNAVSLRIYITSCEDNLPINGVQLNAKTPFYFFWPRFWALWFILFCGYCLFRYRLYRKQMQISHPLHRFAFGTTLFLAIAFAIYTFLSSQPQITFSTFLAERPEQEELITCTDPYLQQADAILKGRFSLDLPVDERLEDTRNPYDPSQRESNYASYIGQRAFYNNHYYSPYGIAPVFINYLPIYFLTGHFPTTEILCVFYAVLFIVGVFFCVPKFLQLFVKKLNFIFSLLAPLAVVFCSNSLWCLRSGNSADIPYLAGLAFFFWAFYFMLLGVEKHKTKYFFFSGLFCALLFGSYAILCIYLLLPLAFFIRFLWQPDVIKTKKYNAITALFLPILIGTIFILCYNAVCFSSPFDFGQKYLLTSSNLSHRSYHLFQLFPMVYHYLFQLCTINAAFPFVRISGMGQVLSQFFYPCSATMGILAYPAAWLIVFLPFSLKQQPRFYKQIGSICLLAPLLLCFLQFVCFGVSIRLTVACYFCFILCGLLAAAIIQQNNSAFIISATNIALFFSIVIGFFISFAGQYQLFLNSNPKLFVYTKYLFEWWL